MFTTEGGVADAAGIEDVDTHAQPRVWFERNANSIRAVTVWPGEPVLLADVCGMFESFGLRMAAHRQVDEQTHVFEFGAVDLTQDVLDLIADACLARAAGLLCIDTYARLVAAAGITWREMVLVRAACRFVQQTGLGLSESYVVDALVRAPEFVRAIVVLFRARLDPAGVADADAAAQHVAALVDAANTLDEDRIRRALAAFVRAVLRTNWFQRDADGAPKRYISFKIDSSALSILGPVVPYREIFVHSEEVEGVHLRSGAVARGGLRWSDRSEDFRTEVLGLMKTQAVKNAPIVPMGAKGAFVIRRPGVPAPEAYKTFIRGLLDVTDNIVAGAIVHPADTVCADGADAYLVVAADKGTARFSDLANSIAAEYNFWLGDAFASGGSAGYDHKAMGITARGAWLSVQRHFAEMGRDTDVDEFTVAGIGDMSGDVFGNGMLLSHKIRLVAAFDHRDIFLDPEPDAATSYAERARLFALPGSSWRDYEPASISAGGGVWPRTAKSIPLSPEVRARLGIDATELTPDELVAAILRAPVDLLWNGGIGTYVRSDSETDTAAQDPANDRVRVAASELRCTVVGEGGNLGFTQQARIDYALGGGRINADFIDNAAGVATSDLEVNLKIALDAGPVADRNTLLERATDDVARRVLAASSNQILAISLAAEQAGYLLERHIRLIRNLEVESGIDPSVEGLPSPAELKRRAASGRGLTRPEIAVLLAQSKNLVCHELLESDVPDSELFSARLQEYFPGVIADVAAPQIAAHPLRREIIATVVADELINRIGPGTIYRLQERLGATTAEVAMAYGTVREVLGLEAVWAEALAREVGEAQRIQELLEIRELVEHLTSWLLRRRREADRDDTLALSVRHLIDAGRS